MDPRENLTAGEVLYPDWNGPEKIEEAPSLTPVNPLDHARNQSQPSVADILYPGDESVKPVNEVRPMSPENIAYRERARHWGSEAAQVLYPNMGAAEEEAGRRLMEAERKRKQESDAGSVLKPKADAPREEEWLPDWEKPPAPLAGRPGAESTAAEVLYPNMDATEKDGNNQPSPARSNQERGLDIYADTYRGYAGTGRMLGLDLSAKLLEHYMDGTGANVSLSPEQVRPAKPIADAENWIRSYFEESFQEKGPNNQKTSPRY